jgi:hypothetical protein
MSCYLSKINHEGAKKPFVEEELLCPIFKRANGSLPTVCAHCCVRIQQLADTKKDLLWRNVMDYSEYQREPSVILRYLPEHLKQYYEVLTSKGKSIENVVRECSRCRSGINQPLVRKAPFKVTK